MEQEQIISIFSLIALVVFILIVIFIVIIIILRNKRNADIRSTKLLKIEFEDLLKQTRMEVQENTLSVISKELHDNVGQLLSSSRMLLGITERDMPQPPQTLLSANETLKEAIGHLRSISKSLDKDWLEKFNLNENLKNEISRLDTGSGSRISVKFADTIFLDSQKQLILFRVIQESIQNTLKHSQAGLIEINFEQLPGALAVSIQDDGKGFDILNASSGMGLENMKYRVKLLNGDIQWETSPGNGTKIFISIPH